jgi:HSP20 family protein
MALQRMRPFGEMQTLQNQVNRLFDVFFNREIDEGANLTTTWYPQTNIFEKEDEYVFKMDVPGLKTEDIHIEFKDGALVISGERKEEKDFKKEEFHRIETVFGNFSRAFNLPSNVNQDKIVANLKNGILEVKVAKAEEAKPKSIHIGSS